MGIHGDRTPDQRKEVLSRFRNDNLKILITTDVSARGIDIPNVNYVVNYDLPEITETYIHRVGRTGRGKLKGEAISFCTTQELPLLKEIEKNLPKPITQTEIGKDEYQYAIDMSNDSANTMARPLKRRRKGT